MRHRDARSVTGEEPNALGAGPDHALPDARDGLTRVERVVLWKLSELQREREGRHVPTALRYGRVVEHVNISEAELTRTLQRLIGVR